MARILIVDDEEIVQRLLFRTITSYGNECTITGGSKEARNALAVQTFELMLCDVNMPGETGIELARFVGSEYPDIAVIMVTGVDDPGIASATIDAGAYGYMIKPFNPNELIINIQNALRRRKLEIDHRTHRRTLEKMVADRTLKLNQALEGIIHAMSLMIEKRDPYTAGHQRRVASLAAAIALEMDLSGNRIEGIRLAGMIHDLGKIAIPAEILSKPSRLTDIEFALIKTHSQAGYEIVADIEFPWPIARMILEHHERIDGSGYPGGLLQGEILPEARILAVADVVEAISTHRPYRPALGVDAALDEINVHRGILYDPEAVDACLNLFKNKGYSLEG